MPLWGRMFFGRSGRNEHYERGIRLFDQGQFEPAIAAFQASLTDGRGGHLVERLARFYLAEAHSALAASQLNGGGSERAIENLKAALEINPSYADLHCQLGRAYLNRERYGEAAACFERALDINPQYARASLLLGATLYARDDAAASFRRVEAAMAWDPTLSRDLFREVREADARGERDVALRLLNKMNEAEANDALSHARTALDLYRRGMYADAAASYRMALAIQPDYADLRNQLGVTLYALGQDPEAAGEFEKALAINPRYVEAILNLGLVLRRLGRTAEARERFERVLALDPGNAAAQESLDSLAAAVAA